MEPLDFEFLRQLLLERSGAVVTLEKNYLINSRLAPIARAHGHADVGALVKALRWQPDEAVMEEIVDAMTTNETLFFRDAWPFQRLRDIVLPEVMKRNHVSKRLRIWSAACSSGQEPYSIAIVLSEMKHLLAGWQANIVGTDISSEALGRAVEAKYTDFEVRRGLSDDMLSRYFRQEGANWFVRPEVRGMVDFKKFNLLNDPMATGLFGFDVIFCRNVLIYFDEKTRARVLASLARALRPGGYLLLGGAETVVGFSDAFSLIRGERGLFQLNEAGGKTNNCA